MSPKTQVTVKEFAASATTRVPNEESVKESMREEQIPLVSLCDNLKVISDNQVVLNEDLAERFVSMANFVAERPIEQSHVEYLLQQMRQGTFRWEQVTLMSAVLDGVEHRINAQHTVWAYFYFAQEADHKSFRNPTVRYIRYRCSSEEDLRMLYATTDRGKPRTRSHQIIAHIFGAEEFAGLPRKALTMTSQGLSPWLNGFQSGFALPTDKVVYLMKTEHHSLSKMVCTFLAGVKETHMTRASVVASLFATYSVSQSDSDEFWPRVRDGVSLDKSDPRLKLRNYLMTHAVNAGRGSGHRGLSTVSGEEMYRTCIAHWNAWRSGKKTGEYPKVIRVVTEGDRPRVK